MQRGLPLFFNSSTALPILSPQLTNRQDAHFHRRASVSIPDVLAPATVKSELDGATSAESPRSLRIMLGLEVGVEICELEQQPTAVAPGLELAELHEVVQSAT
jgi:hypothetical protein